jgi:hypothetical protein
VKQIWDDSDDEGDASDESDGGFVERMRVARANTRNLSRQNSSSRNNSRAGSPRGSPGGLSRSLTGSVKGSPSLSGSVPGSVSGSRSPSPKAGSSPDRSIVVLRSATVVGDGGSEGMQSLLGESTAGGQGKVAEDGESVQGAGDTLQGGATATQVVQEGEIAGDSIGEAGSAEGTSPGGASGGAKSILKKSGSKHWQTATRKVRHAMSAVSTLTEVFDEAHEEDGELDSQSLSIKKRWGIR